MADLIEKVFGEKQVDSGIDHSGEERRESDESSEEEAPDEMERDELGEEDDERREELADRDGDEDESDWPEDEDEDEEEAQEPYEEDEEDDGDERKRRGRVPSGKGRGRPKILSPGRLSGRYRRQLIRSGRLVTPPHMQRYIDRTSVITRRPEATPRTSAVRGSSFAGMTRAGQSNARPPLHRQETDPELLAAIREAEHWSEIEDELVDEMNEGKPAIQPTGLSSFEILDPIDGVAPLPALLQGFREWIYRYCPDGLQTELAAAAIGAPFHRWLEHLSGDELRMIVQSWTECREGEEAGEFRFMELPSSLCRIGLSDIGSPLERSGELPAGAPGEIGAEESVGPLRPIAEEESQGVLARSGDPLLDRLYGLHRDAGPLPGPGEDPSGEMGLRLPGDPDELGSM